jgi:hypothetical protein
LRWEKLELSTRMTGRLDGADRCTRISECGCGALL